MSEENNILNPSYVYLAFNEDYYNLLLKLPELTNYAKNHLEFIQDMIKAIDLKFADELLTYCENRLKGNLISEEEFEKIRIMIKTLKNKPKSKLDNLIGLEA